MTDKAMVETLTAEVRVLMIGNRQVTLSVFRQLDSVFGDEINPFGRVRDPRAEELGGLDEVQVVGRSKTDGTLVRASAVDPRFGEGNNHEWYAAWTHLPLIVLAGMR